MDLEVKCDNWDWMQLVWVSASSE